MVSPTKSRIRLTIQSLRPAIGGDIARVSPFQQTCDLRLKLVSFDLCLELPQPLRIYLDDLRRMAPSFGPTERFLMQRIEGLERLVAAK